ncbi:WD repeat-containing protein 17 [Nymphon striatum]|nr:WD repeat-containing protein 17 [Nymphon striatum]
MVIMRQVSLLAAGCQPWNYNVCCAQKDKFAYASTLAIYIYEMDKTYQTFRLHSIISEHKETICCMEWHPQDEDIIGSSSIDPLICIWSISKRHVIALLDNPSLLPRLITWCSHDYSILSYVDDRGPIHFWKYTKVQKNSKVSSLNKDPLLFSSTITQIKWHPHHIGKIAIGHENGTISLCIKDHKLQKHLKVINNCDNFKNERQIQVIEWDRNSQDYLLVCCKQGEVFLIDTNNTTNGTLNIINNFHTPSAAVNIQTAAWIPGVPGIFVTGDFQNGVLRLWNVSNQSPMENITIHDSGFHAICVTTVQSQKTQNKTAISHISSSSEADPNMNGSYKMPSCRIVCLFSDGGIGLYNLRRRAWDFLRPQGHIETIFDCEFKPTNCDLLATGSFDGTIKIWNVNTMTAEHSSRVNKCIIYAISWAPGDLNCIAAATSSEGVLIWDVKKSSILKKFKSHNGKRVFSVAWHQKDSRKIASSGEDFNCIVHQADGKILNICRHPAAVYGCDWNPNNIEMLATACEDTLVRVYYLAKSQSEPVKIFTGYISVMFSYYLFL